MTIGSGVTLNSTVMAEVVCSRTSLWFWKWFPFSFRPNRWLVTRLIQHSLVNHIPLLLRLHFLSLCGSYHRFFGFHKLHFLGYIGSQTTLSSISQSGSIGERFLMRKYCIKLLRENSLYFSIGLNYLKLKEFYLWLSFGQLSIQRLYFTSGLLISHKKTSIRSEERRVGKECW